MGDIISTNWYIYRVYTTKLEVESESDNDKTLKKNAKKKK